MRTWQVVQSKSYNTSFVRMKTNKGENMEMEEVRTILLNLKQRFEKQWTRNEKEAFDNAVVIVDLRVRENRQRMAKNK